jgi:hypothetical protein
MGNVYRILIANTERKRTLGGPKCKWEDNIKMNIKGIGC